MNKSKKLYLLSMFGNIAEWYDFSIYAFLAAILGKIFFDSVDQQLALIKAFAIFSISYLARPIGSLFFGYLGDRFGRRQALRLSLLLMAVPAVLIGMLPTYGTVGTLATVLLIILRFIQGFATGGEYPGIGCYVYEAAAPHKKSFFCSVAVASPAVGMFLGSAVTTLLYTILPEQAIYNWGWRIPFLLSIVVLSFIFYIRNNLEETEDFCVANKNRGGNYNKELWQELIRHKKSFMQAIPIWIFLEISFYLLFVWMPSYLNVFLNFVANKSFFNSSIGLLSIVAVIITVGYFAKIHHTKKIIIISILGIVGLAYPLFLLLQLKTLPIIIFVQLVFSLFLGALCGVAMFTVGHLFNAKIRYLSIGLSVTIASGIFGGISPTICSYLINRTGYTLAPVFFLITTGIIALLVAATLQPKQLAAAEISVYND